MANRKTRVLVGREDVILKATIEDFIQSNAPIGSTFLKKQHRYNFSPATIRATMSALEEKGLLTHPHVSAGRIPTDLGYRTYVDDLMDKKGPSTKGNKFIREMETMATGMEDLMRATAVMLAKISKLFGVVILKGYQKSILSDIELVKLGSDRIMVVLAMKTGLVRSIVLNLKVEVADGMLIRINEALRNSLVGLRLDDIAGSMELRLIDSDVFEHEIIQILLNRSSQMCTVQHDAVVFTSSYNELLTQPEFNDTQQFQDLLPALETDSLLNDIDLSNQSHWNAVIGGENENELLHDCSLVSAPFKGSLVSGRLALLGPKRMQYSSLKTILHQFAEGIKHVC
ncbi:MAG: heat-inducible transcriptional repressor HrcA [Candidatus Marinimicrobia bacterium]|jgi:heat-inducible transcriptional repressor|nr:heat-inducible transcriptional repressor HrcA [Candidatus Neomarinimicrobiota bacterium]MDP6789256.1 heat-inducible transcriptional repressor HrcA [Candidatus Neomarinimicrobiota bacterium]MDP7072562.1 heat-inducible transcriptional repressor HrcA [Candidatus Neomarinimicrobiota bacterium]